MAAGRWIDPAGLRGELQRDHLKPSGSGFAQLAVSGGSIGRNSAGNAGGVFVDDGSATPSQTHVMSNSADRYAGGVHVNDGNASLTATHVISNYATDLGGS